MASRTRTSGTATRSRRTTPAKRSVHAASWPIRRSPESLDYENTAKDLQQIVKTKKTELLFLALFLRLLKPGGRAAVIVPDGVLFGSSKAHKALREMLVEEHKLDAVISLPSACSSRMPASRPRFWCSRRPTPAAPITSGSTTCEADGWSLDDKRTPLLPRTSSARSRRGPDRASKPRTTCRTFSHVGANESASSERTRIRAKLDGPQSGPGLPWIRPISELIQGGDRGSSAAPVAAGDLLDITRQEFEIHKEIEALGLAPTIWAPLELILLSLESGARPKGGVTADSGEIPSIGGEHVDDAGGFYFTKIKRIPRSFFEGMRVGRIASLDILVVKDGATTGKTSLVREDFPYKEAAVNEHVSLPCASILDERRRSTSTTS